MDNAYIINSLHMNTVQFDKHHITGDISFRSPCIGYVKKGMGRFLYEGTTHVAQGGDLIYIAAGTKYYSVWFGEPKIEFYSFNFSFSSICSYSDYKFQIIKDYPADTIEKMYQAHEQNDHLACMSYLYATLGELYPRLLPSKRSPMQKNIEPALLYIEEHFRENISVSDLARICFCSESSVYKLFQAATGTSPIHYKHNIMIQHALHLLSSTDMTIEEISEECGFSSSNYFRKVFKSITKASPKELRKR